MVTVITIVNYDRKTFIVEATGFGFENFFFLHPPQQAMYAHIKQLDNNNFVSWSFAKGSY
jgi:hypothetical protein